MILEKVFLALRTNYFGDMVQDEHITLKYFQKAEFANVIGDAQNLEPHVPTEISLNGMANWQAGNMYYEGALVNQFENPELFRHTTMPHITIRKSDRPLSNATFVPEFYDREIVDTIWLGKKVKGSIKWMPVDKRDFTAMKINWRHLIEGNPYAPNADVPPMPFDSSIALGHL